MVLMIFIARLCVCVLSCLVISDSLRSHRPQPSRHLCPQNFPGKNTGVGFHFLLQGIFLTQESNPCLLRFLHCQVSSLPLATWEALLHDSVQFSSVAQSCLTLCVPMDCSLPGSSVHRIFQARILEWVAVSSSKGSSQPQG